MMSLHMLFYEQGFKKSFFESPYRKLLLEYERRWQWPLKWSYSGEGRLNGPKRHRNERQFRRLRQLRQYICVDEICRYLELHKVTGICPDNIQAYKDAKNIEVVGNIAPATLLPEQSAFDMICFLDDYMWFNKETKTLVFISASDGYESDIAEIKDFINSMMVNPTILHGRPIVPGVEVMAVFITE